MAHKVRRSLKQAVEIALGAGWQYAATVGYYDLYKLAVSDMGRYAARDMGMLADVGAFKRRFYTSKWARYETAVPGSMRLLPREDQLADLRRDNAAMDVMISGELVPFAEILRGLGEVGGRD